ncbi:MAG: cache domain-containing protein [Methanotrichaceae archaeon]
MEALKAFAILFLLGAVISPGICAAAASRNNSSSTSITVASAATSHADLIAFVDSAVAYAKANGKDNAIKEFNNNKSTQFIKGELYIFAVDFNGTTIAHPYRPDFVGKSQMDLNDTNGVLFFKNMAIVAKRGNGSVYYVFANPAHNKKPELKLTYVEKVDDTWWLGAGTYLSNISANFSQASRNNLTSFVDSAVNYAKEKGKDKALKEFNNKNGTFFKGGLYVFAYDFNGTTLAAPTQPNIIGTNRINVNDPNGVKLIRDMDDIAKGGKGVTYYIYADPTKDMMQGLKLSYVEKVDDTWFLGAGIYAQ